MTEDVADRIRAGVKWLAFGKLATQIGTWAIGIITLRLLNPDVYGLIALATIFVTFISLFEELGLRVKLVQLQHVDPGYIRQVYGLSILTNVVLAAVLVACAPLIAAFFNEPRLTLVIIALALQFVISAPAVIPDAMIKRNLDFRSIATVEIAQGVLAAFTSLALAWLGYGVWSLVVGTIVATLIRTIGLMRISPFHAWPSFRLHGMLDTLKFGGHVTGQRVLWWAYQSYDRFLLGRVFDTHVLGLYYVARDLSSLPLQKLGSTVATASFTGLSRVAADRETFRAYLVKGLHVLSLVAFPICYGVAAVANDLVPILLGPKWPGVDTLVAVLSLIVPFRMLNSPLVEALNSLGRPQSGLASTAIAALLIVAGVSLGAHWGLMGVTLGWVIAYLFAFWQSLLPVARFGGFSAVDIIKAIAPAVLAAVAMLLIVRLARLGIGWPAPSIPGLAISIAIGVAVYGTAIALFDRFGLKLLLGLVRGK
jgi:teichuronic acid exporter